MDKLSGVQIIGMVWYKPEEFDACMAIMADRSRLHQSYHLWLMDAEAEEKRQRRAGRTVIRSYIDPQTFPDWCLQRGLDINAQARNQFAAWVAYQIATGGHQDSMRH